MSVAGAFVGGSRFDRSERRAVAPGVPESHGGRAQPLGLRSIIVYKTIKGWLELTLGVGLLILLPMGLARWLAAARTALRHDLAQAWSVWLAEILAQGTSHHRIHLTIGIVIVDALVTLVEARALVRGLRWAPWLVVGTVGTFLPFELAAGLAHPSPMRALLLAANLTIVAYLARFAWRAEHFRSPGRALTSALLRPDHQVTAPRQGREQRA